MDSETLTFKNASFVSIVETLEKMGYHPTRMTRHQAWYLSPLRSESRASFNVSIAKNLWYDFGLGRGGNVIDLVAEIRRCSPRDALGYLCDNNGSLSSLPKSVRKKRIKRSSIEVIRVSGINHPGLARYLISRNVPPGIAGEYCREVHYRLKGREYISLGLPNHLGGWELRNKSFKCSTSPKTYSYIKGSSQHLLITEGIFDFLSLATLHPELVNSSDNIILNSLSFLDPVKTLIPGYRKVELFLDNDPAGTKATSDLLSSFENLTDRRESYRDYNDLNEMLQATSGNGKS